MAKANADKALQLNPAYPSQPARLYYYWCLLDHDDALEYLSKAQAAKPGDSLTVAMIGFVVGARALSRRRDSAAAGSRPETD